jgi:hypothetical protein
MPKITVRVPHQLDPSAAFARLLPALEKTAHDFQGRDLELTQEGNSAQFSFTSMAFTITGRAEAGPAEAIVEVDLPFAALMFKDQAERAVTKNVTRALTDAGAAPPPATT